MGTREGILIKKPRKCAECPCVRNNDCGFYCFLTEENLTYHNIDVTFEVGDDCPAKEYDEDLFED